MEQANSSDLSAESRKIYEQFERSMTTATIMRLLRATHVISELRERKNLLNIAEPIRFSIPPETVSTENEDSTAWEKITVDTDKLQSVLNEFSAQDPEKIYVAALLSAYLRSMQLVTDFLLNDRMIPVSYAEQNLNRALNQLILLEQIETYLQENYTFNNYA